tara:strand:+ start:133 stop:339 length:207 start_codon:yes stop_codon:yes gene_type:complete
MSRENRFLGTDIIAKADAANAAPTKTESPIPDYKKTGVDKTVDLYGRRQNEDANANRSSLSTNDSRRG